MNRKETSFVVGISGAILIALSVYYFAYPSMWGKQKISGDGWEHYALTHSLFFDEDLNLNNQFKHCCNQFGKKKQPQTKRYATPKPIGTSILWLPFMGISHLAAQLKTKLIGPQPTNGYSNFYYVGTVYASVFYLVCAFVFIYLFLRRRFSISIASVACLSMLMAGPALFFAVEHPSYSHSTELFAASVFIFFWDLTRGNYSLRRWFGLGTVVGIIALIQPQHILLSFAPICELLYYLLHGQASKKRRIFTAIGCSLTASITALLLLSINFLSWHYFYGNGLTVPQGSWFMQWGRFSMEHALNILFWSRNGLLSWHPIHWLALLGLCFAVFMHSRSTLFLLAVFLTEWYANSVCADLWGGWSFGHRRFICLAPIFAFGLAAALAFIQAHLIKPWRWLSQYTFVSCCLFFSLLNIGLMASVSSFKIKVSIPQDMRTVYSHGLSHISAGVISPHSYSSLLQPVWNSLGNPFALPGALYAKIRYQAACKDYDQRAGAYFLYRFHEHPVPVSHHMGPKSQSFQPFIAEGRAISNANKHGFVAPCKHKQCELRFAMPFWLLRDNLKLEARTSLPPCAETIVFWEGYEAKWSSVTGSKKLSVNIPKRYLLWGTNQFGFQINLSNCSKPPHNILFRHISFYSRR